LEREGHLVLSDWTVASVDRKQEETIERFSSESGEPAHKRLPISQWMNALDGHLGPSAVDAAVIAVSKMGPEAIPYLGRGLRARTATVRANTCRCLGVLGIDGADAVVGLRDTLSDESYEVRRAAAEALGCIGGQARVALADLRALAADPAEPVRTAATEAIERITR